MSTRSPSSGWASRRGSARPSAPWGSTPWESSSPWTAPRSRTVGEEVGRLHARLSGGQDALLVPQHQEDPVQALHHLDPPESTTQRLLFQLKRALPPLLENLAQRGMVLQRLALTFILDRGGRHRDLLEPARPTLDLLQLMRLLQLRLEGLALASAVASIEFEALGLRASQTQIELFRVQRRRDLDAGTEALAQVRARFGPDSVCVGKLQPAHLPEARARLVPTHQLRFPSGPTPPDPARIPPPAHTHGALPLLVRRVLERPQRLSGTTESDAPPSLPTRYGDVLHAHGPWRVSGAWWARAVERDYYYLETTSGAILWVYLDRVRRRWFLHGLVD